jgi:hypothetical protein
VPASEEIVTGYAADLEQRVDAQDARASAIAA